MKDPHSQAFHTHYGSMQIIAIAASKLVRTLPVSSMETCIEGTSLSKSMNVGLESQLISKLLDMIGSFNLYRLFSSELLSRIIAQNSMLYDITSSPLYGTSEILEYDHEKDHPDLEQVNLYMVLDAAVGYRCSFKYSSEASYML